MKRFLFLSCALGLAGAVQANSPGAALTAQQISDQATAESKSLQVIERQADGRVRMTAPMQAMEALIGPKGMKLRSVDAGGEAAFDWRLDTVGRADRLYALGNTGEVVIEGERVAVLRAQAIEEFTASADGIRQDFVIPQPPPAGEGGLVLELEANGADLENLPDNDQAVTLRMPDGRELHYHTLRVTDASGQETYARMHAQTETRLRIVVDDAGAQYPIRVDPTFSDADWTVIAAPDFDGAILAVVLGGGDLYVGGNFIVSPNGVASHIARWDGSVWSALGEGVNGSVSALAWDEDNGHLYAGGGFTFAGGSSANHVARWDGSVWSTLGNGTASNVFALAWDAGNGYLYAGGRFSTAGGNSVNRIARWNGTTWSALGDGMSGGIFLTVHALAWDAAGGHLYVGGDFTFAGDNSANRIARWDGVGWSALGDGMDDVVHALAWDEVNGHLYAGGVFNFAGGKSTSGIARWDGVGWSAVGGGINGSVNALAWDAVNAHLFAGVFRIPNDNFVFRWDGEAWSVLDTWMNSLVRALAWDAVNSYLYAGGEFSSIGDSSANFLARWDGTDWSTLGSGMNDTVHALVWDAPNGHLYAGGGFTSTGDDSASAVARWDGDAWSRLGSGLEGFAYTLAWDAANGHLYAGGAFSGPGGTNIARWDGANWSSLGSMNHWVYALSWDAANDHLYAGGVFTSIGGNPASHIARWDGAGWSPLGSGLNGTVNALTWDAANGHLYAGGAFKSAGGNPVNRVARWDGGDWSALADGTNGSVDSLIWDAANDHLYVGGHFSSAGGINANSVARWDGAAWSALGDGINGAVRTLVWDASNGYLYAGGGYLSGGCDSYNCLNVWDGATWSDLDNGMNSMVLALAWDAGNKQLYVGGDFTIAGDQAARIARLETRLHQDPPLAVTATPDSIEFGQQSTLSVTGGAGTGTVNYAITAGTEFCGVSDNILTGIGVGICTATATATKAGDADYRPSSDAVDVTVTKAAGTLVFNNLSLTYNGNSHEVTAYIDEEPETICTADESPIGPDAGDYPVTATCDGTNYVASGDATATIAKAEQAPMKVTADPALIVVGESSMLSFSGGSGDGEISLAVSEGAENCELDANTLIGLAAGSCTVTAIKAGDANYHPSSDSVSVTVVPEDVFADRFETL